MSGCLLTPWHLSRGIAGWLLVAVLAPPAVWLAGRGIERVWLGPRDVREPRLAAAHAQDRIERAYQTLFAQLSSASEAAARRPDWLRAARDPSTAKALFSLAGTAVTAIPGPSDETALTIYDGEGVPVAWTGKPTDLPASAMRVDGFVLRQEQTGVRLVRVSPVLEGQAPVGSIVVERVLAPSPGIRSRFGRDVDFTVASAGVPVQVTYGAGGVNRATRGQAADAATFIVRDPRGGPIVRVVVPADALEPVRQRVRGVTCAVAVASSLVPLVALLASLGFKPRRPSWSGFLAILALVWIVRLIILWTKFPLQVGPIASFSPQLYGAHEGSGLLGSPAHFALTGVAVLVTVLIGVTGFGWLRREHRHRRVSLASNLTGWFAYLIVQFVTALVAVAVAVRYDQFIGKTTGQSAIDLLHFSFHPWSTSRIALQLGMVAFHASAALLLVLIFQVGLYVVRRPGTRRAWLPAQAAVWAAVVTITLVQRPSGAWSPFFVGMYFVAALAACYADRLTARLRPHSATGRLAAGFVVLAVPALLWYPSTAYHGQRIKRQRIESQLAPEIVHHREAHFAALRAAITQIDADDDLSTALGRSAPDELRDLAFHAWERTALFSDRLTSAVEIYDDGGVAVSRFALNLPSYKTREPLRETNPTWQLGEETAPIGSRRVRVMYAMRAIYLNGDRVGLIVVRVAHDYDTLPIVASQNPYEALFGTAAPEALEDTPTHDVDLAVYDTARALLFASSRPTWTINDTVAERMRRRDSLPFWDQLARTSAPDDVYVFSDSEAIYVLGYPQKGGWARATEMSELIVLIGAIYLSGAILVGVYGLLAGVRHLAPTQVSTEVASSFYRKLSLAFVGASVVPIVSLSFVVRAEFAARARVHIEAEAQTIVAVAKRVVEDYEASGGAAGRVDDDDVMVWIRSAIGQDVTVFAGSRLLASSQRDLFASGLLPTRTPAPLYEAVALDRAPQYVGDERIGDFSYLTAAAPLRFHGQDAIITVPLAARQRESGREMDALDRELVLVTLVFVLSAGALGYWMAERIADPVGRLTRATRRVAEGDLDTKITTTSQDEIQRLVSAFNRMAGDLKAQREQLKRASRLEASAEIARQVAHEIKNPLTPIQLSAEHLRRVHADGTTPAPGVVDRCVGTILQQVRLLRQIASEFATFGTTPSADVQPWSVRGLLDDAVAPYQAGFEGRIDVKAAAVPRELPCVLADRVLVLRSLTNLIENSIQAIPERGQVVLQAGTTGDHHVSIDVIDTGTGIEPQVLTRIFDPYFSTRSGGTGLGMAIVKRNIEACGGTIEVTSEPGRGTRVHIVLRADEHDESATQSKPVDAIRA